MHDVSDDMLAKYADYSNGDERNCLANLSKTSTEALLAKHDAEAKSVEGRVASMQQEIDRISPEKGELQQALEKERVAQKAIEDTIDCGFHECSIVPNRGIIIGIETAVLEGT